MDIVVFKSTMNDAVCDFLLKAFNENRRKIDFKTKDSDLLDIQSNYQENGEFWCAIDWKGDIIGTIGLRKLSDCYEIRRFFVNKKNQGKNIGTELLNTLIEYAISINAQNLRAAVMIEGKIVQSMLLKYGFCYTKRYNESSADLFMELELTSSFIYRFRLNNIRKSNQISLILNPTENIPCHEIDTSFIEGLYVSERFKDLNDKIIFAGRNDYIRFCEYVKEIWKKKLNASDADLKTLSGLNAHLVLFLCIMKANESVLILPEICGGHFATQKILESFGANVYSMISDCSDLKVDKEKTLDLIHKINPTYIFVDRSEGLNYEDFSWIGSVKNSYKIFDASQYFTQIITNDYPSPFEWGFDMIVSTLHKNYPGPQKGIIAVQDKNSTVWRRYLENAKMYISNTHPVDIVNSVIPLLDEKAFINYSKTCIECASILDQELKKRGVTVISRRMTEPSTLHIWIQCDTKAESYEYYLKLEKLHLLTNYRMLPYDMGFGLRIGISAAVRQGLLPKHIPSLADIMAYAYHNPLDASVTKKAAKLIRLIKG